jgi:hypothetical protein
MGKGVNNRSIPNGKTQVNFNIENAVLDKVKDLAFWEGATHSEIYNKSVVRFLELYEEKKGKIKRRPAGKGLDV